MVGKVSSGASFSGLAKYLTGGEERVAWTEPRWMIGTDPQEVAREMEAAASLAGSRMEKPVYHISVSFGEADNPTREQMREAAERVLGELGLGEHQALLVAHQDKEHPHLHIMVNRVHPDTGKAADVAFDYRQVEGVLREMEKEWGMQRVPGHHARDDGDPAPDRTQAVATGEARRAHRTGEATFPEQIREKMGDDLSKAIEGAKSWDELQAALGHHGYRIEPTERGMKVTDGERYAKASSVDERLGRFRLEERFGERLDERLTGEKHRAQSPAGVAFDHPPARSPKEHTLPAGEQVPGQGGSGPSVYESLFGKPALERSSVQGSPPGTSGSGQLLGAVASAARPVSSEDGEKEVPFRATEVGLRGAAALVSSTGRSSPASDAEGRGPARASGAEEANSKGPEPDSPERPGSFDTSVRPNGTVPVPDPEVRALVRDVRAYGHSVELEQRLRRAAGAYAETEHALSAAGRQGHEAARLSETFDRALGQAYRDPAAARKAFEMLGEQKGPEAAARAMRQAPEQFGDVVAAERKKWLGLASELSKADGYAAARGAANVGEQYLHTRRATPEAGSRSALEATLRVQGSEMKGLRQELAQFTRTHGSPSDLLRGIGQQTQKLTTAQINGLRRALTPMQFGVVAKAAGLAAEAVKGRTR